MAQSCQLSSKPKLISMRSLDLASSENSLDKIEWPGRSIKHFFYYSFILLFNNGVCAAASNFVYLSDPRGLNTSDTNTLPSTNTRIVTHLFAISGINWEWTRAKPDEKLSCFHRDPFFVFNSVAREEKLSTSEEQDKWTAIMPKWWISFTPRKFRAKHNLIWVCCLSFHISLWRSDSCMDSGLCVFDWLR